METDKREETGMKKLFLSLLVIVFIYGAGCDSEVESPYSASNTAEENVIDLGSPTGGFTLEDEEPVFGEPDQYRFMDRERAYCDSIDPERDRDRERLFEGAVKFRLRSLWGRLACGLSDTLVTDCCGVDWSGGMTFDGGIIVIEKLIAFDQEDEVKRIDRSTIEWVSRTCPHFDGIQVRLIVPPFGVDSLSEDNGTDVEARLTINAGPFSRTFTLEELYELNVMQPVDRCCNSIIVNSHFIPPSCPNGYLFGKWEVTGPDTLYTEDTGEIRGILMGGFRGAWINQGGHFSGYVKGIFGNNAEGEHLFFGKYIDFNGHFKGILRGKYGPPPEMSESIIPFGWFEGEWYGKNMITMGRLGGRWISDTGGTGFFHGLWDMYCGDRSDLNPESQ